MKKLSTRRPKSEDKRLTWMFFIYLLVVLPIILLIAEVNGRMGIGSVGKGYRTVGYYTFISIPVVGLFLTALAHYDVIKKKYVPNPLVLILIFYIGEVPIRYLSATYKNFFFWHGSNIYRCDNSDRGFIASKNKEEVYFVGKTYRSYEGTIKNKTLYPNLEHKHYKDEVQRIKTYIENSKCKNWRGVNLNALINRYDTSKIRYFKDSE